MKKLLALSWVLLLIGIVCIFVDVPRAQVNLPLLGVGGSNVISWTATQDVLSASSAGSTSLTINNVAFQAGGSCLAVVAFQYIDTNNDGPTSVTIGGVAATQAAISDGTNQRFVAIYYLNEATCSTPATVVVNDIGGIFLTTLNLQAGVLRGVSSSTGSGSADYMLRSGATSASVSCSVTNFGIWIGYDVTGTDTLTAGNVTIDKGFTTGNDGEQALGHNSTPGSQTITLTGPAGGWLGAAAVACF